MTRAHFNRTGGTPTAGGRFVDVTAVEPAGYAPWLAFRAVDVGCREIDASRPPRAMLLARARSQRVSA